MIYEHFCGNCNKEFEMEYSIKSDPPDTCILCNCKGKVKRLISLCSGKVELSGFELKQHLKEEGQKLKREVYSSEQSYANIIGDDRYQQIQTQLDKQKR